MTNSKEKTARLARLALIGAGLAAAMSGVSLANAAPAQAGECAPVAGCVVEACLDTECPMTDPPHGNIICVGGENQRKPGYYQGVCIG